MPDKRGAVQWSQQKLANWFATSYLPTLFPESLLFPPLEPGGGKKRDPANEVGYLSDIPKSIKSQYCCATAMGIRRPFLQASEEQHFTPFVTIFLSLPSLSVSSGGKLSQCESFSLSWLFCAHLKFLLQDLICTVLCSSE